MMLKKNLGTAIGLFILLVAVLSIWELSHHDLRQVHPFPPNLYLHLGVALILIYSIKAFVMVIPVTFLYIAAGAVLPLPAALLATTVGLSLEFSLGYWTGHHLGREKIAQKFSRNKKMKQLLEAQDQTEMACFFLRLIPFPVDPTSILLGSTGIKFSRYLIFSLLGIAPKAIPFILMGEAIDNPLSPSFLLPFAISLFLITAGLLLYRRHQSLSIHK